MYRVDQIILAAERDIAVNDANRARARAEIARWEGCGIPSIVASLTQERVLVKSATARIAKAHRRLKAANDLRGEWKDLEDAFTALDITTAEYRDRKEILEAKVRRAEAGQPATKSLSPRATHDHYVAAKAAFLAAAAR